MNISTSSSVKDETVKDASNESVLSDSLQSYVQEAWKRWEAIHQTCKERGKLDLLHFQLENVEAYLKASRETFNSYYKSN